MSEVKIEDMSQDELIALEDQQVEDDAKVEEEPEVTVETPEAEVEEVKVETPDPDPEPVVEPEEPKEDLTKHISPPSKWAAQRQAAREAKETNTKFEAINKEYDLLKQENEWLKSQAQSKGVDTSVTPQDILSPEKIAAVREEFGDDMADMFQAVRSLQGVKTTAVDPVATEQPVTTPTVTPDATNDAMNSAISDNDDLAYWQENSSSLWDRAVAVNQQYLRDPEYVKLPFDARFRYVVDRVKTDVVEEAKEKSPEQQAVDIKPPESLSGAGSAPTIENKESVDKILDMNPDDQAKAYNSMSESERDEIDTALGI